MMSGYGMHGYGNQAMELFHQMRTCGPAPNDVTFIAILSAFAHTGLVREGREVLTCMKQHYKIVPRVEHLVCNSSEVLAEGRGWYCQLSMCHLPIFRRIQAQVWIEDRMDFLAQSIQRIRFAPDFLSSY
ncbi:Pentatricopeptide repeat-containing protein [Thalictrum thalictroides]|uniref:Pentatricopeptide repeat-containing protein n=1 Tax=Thalictrum thalictroides TaxID=46969 RepID=A0A7J6WSZ3_THATH|nr:Pentatricopeptide repeat-containing protein [Thalictrum thalictroides]